MNTRDLPDCLTSDQVNATVAADSVIGIDSGTGVYDYKIGRQRLVTLVSCVTHSTQDPRRVLKDLMLSAQRRDAEPVWMMRLSTILADSPVDRRVDYLLRLGDVIRVPGLGAYRLGRGPQWDSDLELEPADLAAVGVAQAWSTAALDLRLGRA